MPIMHQNLAERLSTLVQWAATGNAIVPYRANVGAQLWTIRVNDFPAEPLYTLLIDGRDVGSFNDWPAAWQRPGDAAK